METISPKYMTVSVDEQPDGLNLSCWFSTAEFWASEVVIYPNQYTHIGGDCEWIIHANKPLSVAARAAVTEYADKICRDALEKNSRRKPVNRR